MPLKSNQIPPVKNLKELARFLQDFNADISPNYIVSVELGTKGRDKGRNLIIFNDAKTEPLVPELREFPGTLTETELGKRMVEVADTGKLVERNFGRVLLGSEEQWVALFDPAPVAKLPDPKNGDTLPAFGPLASAAIGTITSGHWLDSAKREPLGKGSELTPLFVVIHYTEGWSAESSIGEWRTKNNGILAHIVVDRDGKIFQCRPFDQTCRHAGASRLRHPKTGKLYDGLNSVSIGIEIANTGQGGDDNLHASLKKNYPPGKLVTAAHRNAGIPEADPHAKSTQWETYPEAQLNSVFGLVALLMNKYELADITGHDCIAYERKTDPGPAFPMLELRAANGLSGLPDVLDEEGQQIDV